MEAYSSSFLPAAEADSVRQRHCLCRNPGARAAVTRQSPQGHRDQSSSSSSGGEVEVLVAEVGQRLVNLGSYVATDLVAVGVEGVDVGGDDVAALGEVVVLHLVQDLGAQCGAGGGVGLPVQGVV